MFLLKREEVKSLNKEHLHLGYIIKTKFFLALLAGFLSLGSVIFLFGFTSTAFALPISGMGDFYVKFDKLEGEGFTLNPHLGETSEEDEAPLVRNKIDEATIEGLHIFKELRLPGDHWIRINITTSQPTTVKGLIQDAKFIDANLSFHDMSIKQTNTSNMSALEAFQQNWTHDANSITITDAEISTAYLFQSAVSLGGAQISVESLDGPYTGGLIGDGRIDRGQGSSIGLDRSGSGGGILPKTATDYVAWIVIGSFLLMLSAVFIFRKKIFDASK